MKKGKQTVESFVMATELFFVVIFVVVMHNKSYLITDTDHGARQCKIHYRIGPWGSEANYTVTPGENTNMATETSDTKILSCVAVKNKSTCLSIFC